MLIIFPVGHWQGHGLGKSIDSTMQILPDRICLNSRKNKEDLNVFG